MIIKGKVHKFSDDINTDDIVAAKYLVSTDALELGKHCMESIRPDFVSSVSAGHIIVAGKNFGCGSSREGAPANLKQLGIGCVVAESFGRIFFRNCIAIALPVMACKGVSGLFKEGDRLQLDFEKALVKNITTGKELKGPALSPDLIKIVQAGGILALLKQESE